MTFVLESLGKVKGSACKRSQNDQVDLDRCDTQHARYMQNWILAVALQARKVRLIELPPSSPSRQ